MLLVAHAQVQWDSDRSILAADDRDWDSVLKVSIEMYEPDLPEIL